MIETTRYSRREDLITTDLDGELVMMCLDSGAYFGLNGVAHAIWHLLAQPVTPDEICARLQQTYEVDSATCQSEVARLLASLIEKRLILQCT